MLNSPSPEASPRLDRANLTRVHPENRHGSFQPMLQSRETTPLRDRACPARPMRYSGPSQSASLGYTTTGEPDGRATKGEIDETKLHDQLDSGPDPRGSLGV